MIRRGAPDGFGAHAVSGLSTGDVLELSPPQGGFTLPEQPGGHHVLIAGGSGITPLATMAAAALHEDPVCRVTLIHSVPTAADALLSDELSELKDSFVDRLTVLYVLTRERHDSGTPGGRIDHARLPRLLTAVDTRPGPGTTYAVCGPAGLVTAVRRALTAWARTRSVSTPRCSPSRATRWRALRPGRPPPRTGPASPPCSAVTTAWQLPAPRTPRSWTRCCAPIPTSPTPAGRAYAAVAGPVSCPAG
ncbi:hypothetical protein NKH18_51130 [Streptomyces sp. M10(2022)]